jgi:hypothetical protein
MVNAIGQPLSHLHIRYLFGWGSSFFQYWLVNDIQENTQMIPQNFAA